MRIVLRKCHTVRYTGACGIIKERESCWDLVDRVAVVLRNHGHEVLVIEGRNDLSDHDQSKEGARIANEWGADVYISFHMNAFNGSARGTEYIVYDNANTKAKSIAKNVCNFMVSLGVPYRREIVNNQFWELRYTNMPATIIELLFCDNAQDVAIWNNTSWDTLVYGVCNAIDSNIPKIKGNDVKPIPTHPPVVEQPKPSQPTPQPSKEKINATYRVHNGYKWLPPITNSDSCWDYAGVFGTTMELIECYLSKGSVIYQAHLLNGGWLSKVRNREDNIGILGREIDGVKMYLEGLPNHDIYYRVKIHNGNWLPWVKNLEGDGYAGIYGRRLEAIEVKIVAK